MRDARLPGECRAWRAAKALISMIAAALLKRAHLRFRLPQVLTPGRLRLAAITAGCFVRGGRLMLLSDYSRDVCLRRRAPSLLMGIDGPEARVGNWRRMLPIFRRLMRHDVGAE